MSAKNVGVRLGKAVGWTGATLWKGTEALIGATGELGEGFMEGASESWEDRCAEMDVRIATAKAKSEARRAELLKLRAEAQARVAAEAKRTTKVAA